MSAPATRTRLRFQGPLAALDDATTSALFDRRTPRDNEVRAATTNILERVRRDGDRALRELARELDGVDLPSLEVPRAACARALEALEPRLRGALERAACNIERAHRAFLPRAVEIETEPGVTVGRGPDPLSRVGLYAPGGRAAYASSVLMTAIPARVAGVPEIVLCSPPGAQGRPSDLVLAAAAIAGVDRVFALGGAGAIAAMTYGTDSVPRVDLVAGPGNAWVAEAKLQVASEVAVDSPAGPSELLVIADSHARPERLAREMLAQAEHDPDAWSLAIVLDETLAEALVAALERELPARRRATVIAASLAARGGVLVARGIDEAIEAANRLAPEHLLLALANPERALASVRHAGAVFLGDSSSVTFGDYLTGANHTLPTGGAGRRRSGLSTADFVRWTSWQRVTPEAAARLADDTMTLANAEGLDAHAAAAGMWQARQERGRAAGVAGARSETREIPLYRPDLRPAPIALHDNTNRFGIPPAALRVLRDPPPAAIARYPDPYADDLKEALASFHGLAPDQIATGCGSDDVIDSAIRAFSSPGDVLAHCDPTFAMAPLFARMNGLTPVAVPLGADLDANADALLATGARIIYLCSPNNPIGGCLSTRTIERVIERAPGVVILDEAYAEFAAPSEAPQGWIRLAPGHPRLVVTRTLSKAFGLAGLRIGYAAGAPERMRDLERSRGPFKVGALAVRTAIAALTEDSAWVRAGIDEVRALRARLTTALRELGFAPLPSDANFVLVPVRDAVAVAAATRAAGVAVRPFPGLTGIGDAVRITIGPWPELEAALAALATARTTELAR